MVNGSLSKTAVNGSAGAKSQLSGLVVAALTVVTLLFLTGLFEDLPEATLAAVVIAALVELVDIDALVRLYRLNTRELARIYGVAARPDFIAAVAAMLGVLIFDTLPGLFIGIGASLVLLLYRASRPHVATLGRMPGDPTQFGDVDRQPPKEPVSGILVLRVEGGLFFANADAVRATIRHAVTDETWAVVLDAEIVPSIDMTASAMLAELMGDLERDGVRLVIAREVGQVRDVLRLAGDSVGPDRVYPTVAAAVEALEAHPPRGRAGHGAAG